MSDMDKKEKKQGFNIGHFVEKNENRINGMVYFGAAILIIIVGLRGLGTIASELPTVPKFLIDHETHKVDPNYVMIALFLEFSLLLIMSVANFFKPVHLEEPKEKEEEAKPKEEISPLPTLTDRDIENLRRRTNEYKAILDESNKAIKEKFVSLSSVWMQFEDLMKQKFTTMDEFVKHSENLQKKIAQLQSELADTKEVGKAVSELQTLSKEKLTIVNNMVEQLAQVTERINKMHIGMINSLTDLKKNVN